MLWVSIVAPGSRMKSGVSGTTTSDYLICHLVERFLRGFSVTYHNEESNVRLVDTGLTEVVMIKSQ